MGPDDMPRAVVTVRCMVAAREKAGAREKARAVEQSERKEAIVERVRRISVAGRVTAVEAK